MPAGKENTWKRKTSGIQITLGGVVIIRTLSFEGKEIYELLL